MNKLLMLSLVALAGCARGEESKVPADSTARNLALAPTESSAARSDVPRAPEAKPAAAKPAAPRPAPPPPVMHTAAAGTFLDIAVSDTLSSRFTKAGDAFTGTLVSDVKDASVVIPAGSMVRGSVLEVKPAPNQNTPGTLKVTLSSAGTVIGGVGGGAIGAGVAVATKDADIVLPKGAHINASLTQPLTVPER